jgi:hypothetical protein
VAESWTVSVGGPRWFDGVIPTSIPQGSISWKISPPPGVGKYQPVIGEEKIWKRVEKKERKFKRKTKKGKEKEKMGSKRVK